MEIEKGLRGLVVSDSTLCKIDGIKGELSYRGYDIAELAKSCSFEEVIHLLWYKELPNKDELVNFQTKLRENRKINSNVIDFIKKAVDEKANPIDVLRTSISMLGTFSKDKPVDSNNVNINNISAIDILVNVPIIVATLVRYRNGKDLLPIRKDLSEAQHFMYLITGEVPGPKITSTLDLLFILQAEHGFNNSTFSTRVVISSMTDFYSAITAAVSSLKGPLHGGANQGIIPMLNSIGNIENIESWIDSKLKAKELIMGIGHPVYKTTDPRAILLKNKAIEMISEIEDDKWIRMGERIEELMKEKKGLYANVDFYSAQVYHSLGIDSDIYTPIFAISRVSGWIAHAFEQLEGNRIYRPSCNYTGPQPGRKVLQYELRGK